MIFFQNNCDCNISALLVNTQTSERQSINMAMHWLPWSSTVAVLLLVLCMQARVHAGRVADLSLFKPLESNVHALPVVLWHGMVRSTGSLFLHACVWCKLFVLLQQRCVVLRSCRQLVNMLLLAAG